MTTDTTYKINPAGTRFNYWATLFSLFLMLYLLGAIGLLTTVVNSYLTTSKEQTVFYVSLKKATTQNDIFSLQQTLEKASYTKPQSVHYLPKEEALADFVTDGTLTEADLKILADNPLPDILNFSIQAAHFDSYPTIVADLEAQKIVESVSYNPPAAQNLADKIYRLEIILILLVIFFIFVSITLIKNNVKLLLLTNKESIRTLQIVGATVDYIARPYGWLGLRNGLISSLLASVVLAISSSILVGGWNIPNYSTILSIILITLVCFGSLLSWAVAKQSIKKYLPTPVENWNL